MCGFAGFLNSNFYSNKFRPEDVLIRMGDAIETRGPDSFGLFNNIESGFGIVHRRLAIRDLSSAGNQPMISDDGRFVLAFNGEIYNHTSLRLQIKNINWRSNSDTETLLNGFQIWGVESTLRRCVGMFAFALWDCHERKLTLGRDRLGEKPLYYGWQGVGNDAVFLFGSDLAALRKHPSFSATIDRNSLCIFLQFSCIGGENSIYKNIKKLLPGHILSFSKSVPKPQLTEWWSMLSTAQNGISNPFSGSPEQAVNELERLVFRSVGEQMVSDVPIGAFLSGGIDSSLIVALMQSQSNRPVKTYSIGFDEVGFNEAHHANIVAKHLNTDHTELYVNARDALDVIPNLPKIYSEPFADSSQIPTLLVSKLARQDVKVSLSGDAGDELFCGYNRYKFTALLWGTLKHVPLSLRRTASAAFLAVPPYTWDAIGSVLGKPRMGERIHKSANFLNVNTVSDLHSRFVSRWSESNSIVIGSDRSHYITALISKIGAVEQMMLMDTVCYLPDDILVKIDRAAMSVGLETRVPMLDYRIVEFAWSLPLSYKLRDGVTKWPLRELLYRHLPSSLIERPKVGFGVPIGQWLRGPLREWAEALLNESRLRQEGYFNPLLIREKWSEHLSSKRNWEHDLWNVLMFQAWNEQNH